MKSVKKVVFPLVAVFALTIQYGCNNKTEETKISATPETIGQMNRDFAKALTAHDAAAAAVLYDENATILPPNEPAITGRTNIQKYWQGAIDAGVIDAGVKTIDAKSDGNLAYEIGSFMMRSKGPKGDTIIEKGKYTEILKLDKASGKWISIYGMWSTDEPAH
jgi:ketosteroid isomerase-like protein